MVVEVVEWRFGGDNFDTKNTRGFSANTVNDQVDGRGTKPQV